MRRRLAIIGVMLLGAMCVTISNSPPSSRLIDYRSIVAAVVRLVLAFQSQVAGLDTPTDIDRKSLIPPPIP